MRRKRMAAVLLVLALAGCTAAPGQAETVPSSDPGAESSSAQKEFETELERKLTLPPIPSFTIPTELLSTSASKSIADQIDVAPGLYQGIAVLDARCTAAGDATASDSGTPTTPTTQHFDDGTTSITVGADGSGVYDAPGVHIAVAVDGSGVYDDGETRLSVAADGSGTYEKREERYTVQADGSGSFSDEDSRIWIDGDGGGGYNDDDTKLSLGSSGKAYEDGDPDRIAAVRAVLDDGLPLFPAVPAVEVVEPTGTVCGTVIRLDANLLFDFGSAAVPPAGEQYLQRVAALLTALDSPRAQVNGHTDQVGDEAANLALSEKRATAVRDLLVRAGVAADSLDAHGLGETEPLRPETLADGSDDAAARQLNRRVEIVLLD